LVISLNVQRRDLTAGQRAVVAARAMPAFEETAKKRMSEGGRVGKSSPTSHRARDDAAAMFKVSDKSVQQAKALLSDAPDLAAQVESCTTSLAAAYEALQDGRNRYRACQELGIDPRFRDWSGEGSPVDFVLSENLHRRHLTPGQKACVAAEAVEMYKAEAKARQGKGRPSRKKTEELPLSLEGDSREELNGEAGEAAELAARATGASRSNVYEAAALKESAPETFERVKAGEITLSQAKKELTPRPPPPPKQRKRPAPAAATQLAAAARVPVSTLRQWEQGRRLPSLEGFFALADGLGVSLDVLAGRQAPAKKQRKGRSTP
jgi:transcriptional regulator with XRE-family HTH domain